MKHHNRQLADAAHNAGVIDPKDYAIFQNYGYIGLYGGLKAQDIRERRGLKPKENILDHMGSTRAGCKPLSRHSDRRKAALGEYSGQSRCQSNPF